MTTRHYDVRRYGVDPQRSTGQRMTIHVRALDVPQLIAKLAAGLSHWTGHATIADCIVSVTVDGEFQEDDGKETTP